AGSQQGAAATEVGLELLAAGVEVQAVPELRGPRVLLGGLRGPRLFRRDDARDRADVLAARPTARERQREGADGRRAEFGRRSHDSYSRHPTMALKTVFLDAGGTLITERSSRAAMYAEAAR